jgi:hypothetical protein
MFLFAKESVLESPFENLSGLFLQESKSPAEAGEVGEARFAPNSVRPPPPFRERVVNRPERAT